ncbi:MAG: RagB/SusD family nutrient uptake outer membrane protein [bacterium]
MKTKKILFLIWIIGLMIFNSCNESLEISPPSKATPENYFTTDAQLAAYSINMYNVFPLGTDGIFGQDIHTDNNAFVEYSDRYVPGQVKVPQDGGDWSFSDIYRCNYFFERVLPLWKSNSITGTNVDHYIGEMYFFRAFLYFEKLQSLGDFPIIKSTLPDQMDVLIEKSKRAPRNEVARFIISDLDSAIMLMNDAAPDGERNRLSKVCAQLIKSRVALYEGTWLKYFKNTAFVPNGPNWPGKNKDYNANYSYPTGSIDSEIEYFLNQAMEASKSVADAVPLELNTMTEQIEQSNEEFANASMENPYCAMFSAEDLSEFSEILLWRDYSLSLNIRHGAAIYTQKGNRGGGLTRGIVDGFLMKNGLPIYDSESGYMGDDSISLVRQNRDGRLWLFLKQPGQLNVLIPSPEGTQSNPVEGYPPIMNQIPSEGYSTGYTSRKGLNYDEKHNVNHYSYYGVPVLRAAEAYLNYIEACYEMTGSLDGSAQSYWQQIRERAGVDLDYQKTIAATDMNEEAKNDWGSYSAGSLVDATLYNIRRERRSELLDEGLRYMDLQRWRSMDQMITTPYHIEGFKLWGPMEEWYDPEDLTYSIGDKSTVSDPDRSIYLRPYERTPTSLVFDGYRWSMAHYLSPIAMQHFLITTDDSDVTNSPIYQNPGWPIEANAGPVQ